jgi:hypothetical protein
MPLPGVESRIFHAVTYSPYQLHFLAPNIQHLLFTLHIQLIFHLLILRPYLHFARGQGRTCLIFAAALSMTGKLLFNNRRTSPSTRALLLSVIWKVRGRIKHF